MKGTRAGGDRQGCMGFDRMGYIFLECDKYTAFIILFLCFSFCMCEVHHNNVLKFFKVRVRMEVRKWR